MNGATLPGSVTPMSVCRQLLRLVRLPLQGKARVTNIPLGVQTIKPEVQTLGVTPTADFVAGVDMRPKGR
jgi:hypothetical protein